MKGKKGDADVTLTWIPATILIIFIMGISLFLGGSAWGSEKIRNLFGGKQVTVQETDFSETARIEQLAAILNSPVEFENKEVTVQDLILLSIDPYIKEDIFPKLKVSDIDDIYTVNDKELFILAGILQYKDGTLVNNEEEKIGKIQEVLSYIDKCRDYVIKIPQGYLYRVGGEQGFLKDTTFAPFKGEYEAFLSTPVNLIIEYKGYQIKVEYREREIC